jgi:hypothetical protein
MLESVPGSAAPPPRPERLLVSQDITSILAGWDFNSEEIQVRLITGDDGTRKIQMRIDLGLLQMELTGRPDGAQPHGFESLLDYHEDRLREAGEAGKSFTLDPGSCASLMREGLQYYHRYLSAFHLQEYDIVSRDTERNLRLFRFVVEHASRQRDKMEFDQYRPYVTMMRTRALALQNLAKNDFSAALQDIDEGIGDIRKFLREYHQEERESECGELNFLLGWRREVEQVRPAGPLERLEHQLELAVALEDYEEAARIRDQIRHLTGPMLREHRGSKS